MIRERDCACDLFHSLWPRARRCVSRVAPESISIIHNVFVVQATVSITESAMESVRAHSHLFRFYDSGDEAVVAVKQVLSHDIRGVHQVHGEHGVIVVLCACVSLLADRLKWVDVLVGDGIGCAGD